MKYFTLTGYLVYGVISPPITDWHFWAILGCIAFVDYMSSYKSPHEASYNYFKTVREKNEHN